MSQLKTELTPATSCCPNISVSYTLGECNADGSREVTFNAIVTSNNKSCPQCTLIWNFGDGSQSAPFVFNQSVSSQTFTTTNLYATCGQSYNAFLSVACSDFGCPNVPFSVFVKCCDDCCPTVTVQTVLGICHGNGSRYVTFNYSITPASDPNCPTLDAVLNIPVYGDISLGSIVAGSGVITGTKSEWLPIGSYNVTLHITSTSNCPDILIPFDVIPCDCCPTLNLTISKTYPCDPKGNMVADLLWTITPKPNCPPFNGTLTLPGGQIVTITNSSPLTGSLSPTLLAGSTYTATLSLANCNPITASITLPQCGSCCPTLVITPHISDCNAYGQHPVSVDYTITPSSNPSCAAINGTLTIGGVTTAIGTLNGTVVLPPQGQGNVIATLTLTSPTPCPPIQKSFYVPPCDCCPIAMADISTDVKEKCNDDGETKNVDINVTVTPFIPKTGCAPLASAILKVDGVQKDSKSGTGTLTLNGSDKYSCGTHTVTVSYPGTGCSDDTKTFCVSVCEKTVDKANRITFETFASSAIISWVLYFFGSLPLLPLAISFTVLAVYVYTQCWKPWKKPCKDCLCRLILWEISLASFLGFLMLSYSALSALWFWTPVYVALIILLVLLIIAIIIFILYRCWVVNCCPTKCEKWKELILTLALCAVAYGMIVAALYITSPLLLPILEVPYSFTIFGAISGLLVLIYAIIC